MRTRTPPEIKWLLVERATIAGDIARREIALQRLAREVDRLKSQLAALDTSIQLVNQSLNPEAVGAIQRHTPEYRQRGALKRFVVQLLQSVALKGVTTRNVVDAAIAHFGLEFSTQAQRIAFTDNTVGRQLRRLQQAGLVEALRSPGTQRTVWRWKNQRPSFQDLLMAPPNALGRLPDAFSNSV